MVDRAADGGLGAHLRDDRAFYTGMSLAAVAAVLAGFARTYFLRSHFQTTPLPLYLQVHGLVFSTWIAFFVAQTTLVAARRTDLHRRLGWAGAWLAAAMVPDDAVSVDARVRDAGGGGGALSASSRNAQAAAYDLASRRRVHAVYLWGGLLVVAGQILRDIVGRTAAWHAVARVLIG